MFNATCSCGQWPWWNRRSQLLRSPSGPPVESQQLLGRLICCTSGYVCLTVKCWVNLGISFYIDLLRYLQWWVSWGFVWNFSGSISFQVGSTSASCWAKRIHLRPTHTRSLSCMGARKVKRWSSGSRHSAEKWILVARQIPGTSQQSLEVTSPRPLHLATSSYQTITIS